MEFNDVNVLILGKMYKIVEENIENDGQTDSSVRVIKLDKDLNRKPSEDDKQDLIKYKYKVLRHEIIHAVMEEAGLSIYDEIANERFVDWIAIMYPRLKEIFEELRIEE